MRTPISHDELCGKALRVVALVSRDAAAAAFVASLRSRNLVARSALGSFAILQHFPAHTYDVSPVFTGRCRVCGMDEEMDHPLSPEELALQRTKYPFQIRHTDIESSAHDLAAFAAETPLVPTTDDAALFRAALAAIRALPATAGLTELNRCLVGTLPSNKYQRQILLEQLGYCGILCPDNQESYRDHFVDFETREHRQPPHFYRREWEYPVRWWTGADGINEAALEFWFSPWL